MKTLGWWSSDKHQLDRVATMICNCPYHEQMRWDAECDMRDNAIEDDDEDN